MSLLSHQYCGYALKQLLAWLDIQHLHYHYLILKVYKSSGFIDMRKHI